MVQELANKECPAWVPPILWVTMPWLLSLFTLAIVVHYFGVALPLVLVGIVMLVLCVFVK